MYTPVTGGVLGVCEMRGKMAFPAETAHAFCGGLGGPQRHLEGISGKEPV